MGIIIRQTFKGSIYSYLGLALGYINVGLIMPFVFSPEQVGLTQLLVATTLIFSQFGTLGVSNATNRLFPVFRTKDNLHHGMLSLNLAGGLLGFLIFIPVFLLLKPVIFDSNQAGLLNQYLFLFVPIIFFRIFYFILDNFNKASYRATVGTFWFEVGYRVINLLFILLFLLKWISFHQYMMGFAFALSFPVLPLILVIIRNGEFKLKINFRFFGSHRREFLQLCLYGLVTGVASYAAVSIDKIMINDFLSLRLVGIFSVCVLFASLIRIPFISLGKISTPVLAEAWKNNDKESIQEVYYRSSLNQLIIGSLIFIGIWANLHNIFRILPSEYQEGSQAMVIYALGILIMTSTGVSSQLIATSKHYKVVTWVTILLITVTIVSNLVFIPIWGITGAALATLFTLSLTSFIRVVFIKKRVGFFCYNRKHLIVLMIAALIYVGNLLIPEMKLIPDILIRNALITLLFGSLIYLGNVSDDANSLVKRVFELLSKRGE